MPVPDYPTITNSQTDAGAPITSQLMKGLSDKPDAIAGGAADAPRNLLPSIENLDAGDNLRSEQVVNTNTGGILETVHSFGFMQSGTIRCTIVTAGSTARTRLVRTRAGVDAELIAESANDFVADVSVLPFDEIRFEGSSTNTTTFTSSLSIDGDNLWAGVAANVQGNNV